MTRRSLFGAFRSSTTRPRAIMWFGVVLCALALFVVFGGMIGTSIEWFCASPCHKVQADTIASYHASTHSNIACVACHEPVNASPLVFVLAKAKSMAEIGPTVTNTYKLPLNPLSAYALGEDMLSKQCTQCHTEMRKITPTAGIIIDHKVHAKDDIQCTTCHNRVAHNDAAVEQTLPGNTKHQDFMKMDACFRCHDLEGKRRAPGTCSGCHPADFKLVPDTHNAEWLPKGHSEAAAESLKEFGAATVEQEELVKEGISEKVAVPVEHCSTCHKQSFCDACHAKLAASLKLTPSTPATKTP